VGFVSGWARVAQNRIWIKLKPLPTKPATPSNGDLDIRFVQTLAFGYKGYARIMGSKLADGPNIANPRESWVGHPVDHLLSGNYHDLETLLHIPVLLARGTSAVS